MPCLDITLPKTDFKTKATMMARLTSLGEQIAGFEPEIFRMSFREYEVGTAGIAGQLWDGEHGHPYLHLVLYCPRMKRSVKRKLIVEYSRAFAEIVGHADWQPVIHICEHPYDNVGGHGEMLSDRPELSERKFYYELPKD
jgi:phenylpyruvate tautomerase PptA (4-oxalocrotonate tautomerase family)